MFKWDFYTTDEIKPDGWLKKQLRIQADGLNGNLDKIWPDIKESAWIGGTREGWERVPYWLDGFIPLAYLLKDEDMIARVKKYVDAILSFQREDGWICPLGETPIEQYDNWAVLLISKTLTVYYQCSKDERIPNVLYRIYKNFYELLKSERVKLISWGKFRWYEGFIALNFLYDFYKEDWLKDLASILKKQGVDYKTLFGEWKKPKNAWRLETHVVNLAMMLKCEAVSCDLLNEPYKGFADKADALLKKYNGTPVETFTGDECLSGLSPIQGTELCAVVEQMYSYEQLFAYTGERKWAEMLEVVAFNALPATISDDMWTHQYVQQSNQIACMTFDFFPVYRTVNKDAGLFGLEPNYGCCTANFGQGWPKLALSAFMHDDDTIISVIPVPSSLDADGVKITLKTDYPFKNDFTYEISSEKDFNFIIRMPSFAENVVVGGRARKAKGNPKFKIKAGEKRKITVKYNVKIELDERPYDLKTVKAGSLIFALPIKFEKRRIEYERKGVERKFPYCDYELIPKTAFNYALSGDKFEIRRSKVGEVPFSSEKPPVTLKAELRRIKWDYADGFDTVCAKSPYDRSPIGKAVVKTLYPYGAAKLRITEFPEVERTPRVRSAKPE